MLKFLQGKKTYIAAAATILGAAVAVSNGSMTLPEAYQSITTGLLAVFLRAGVAKS